MPQVFAPGESLRSSSRLVVPAGGGGGDSGPVEFIGVSNFVFATSGAQPGAITPHANTEAGDLLIFFGGARGGAPWSGGIYPPGSFSTVSQFNENNDLGFAGGHAIGRRIREEGDTTYTPSQTGLSSSEVCGACILTFRGGDAVIDGVDYHWSVSRSSCPLAAGTAANDAPIGAIEPGGVLVGLQSLHGNMGSPSGPSNAASLAWELAGFGATTEGFDISLSAVAGANETDEPITLPYVDAGSLLLMSYPSGPSTVAGISIMLLLNPA